MWKKRTILLSLLILLFSACAPTAQNVPTSTTAVREGTPIAISPTRTAAPTFTTAVTSSPVVPAPTATIASIPESLRSLQVAFIEAAKVRLWRDGMIMDLVDIEPDEQVMDFYTAVNTSPVDLSDDGKYVAYLQGDGSVWTTRVDGTGLNNLFPIQKTQESKNIRPYLIGWLPGTHTLLFSEISWLATSIYSHAGHFYAADVDTGDVKKYTVSESSGCRFFPSPDGKQIAVEQGKNIFLIDTDGTKRRTLVSPALQHADENFWIRTNPIWAADSRSLVLTIALATDGPTQIWQIQTDGEAKKLSQLDIPIRFYGPPEDSIGDPGLAGIWISPDFSHLVYQRALKDSKNVFELHLASSDLIVDKKIATGEHFDVYWSPDSQYFVIEQDGPLKLSDKNGSMQELYTVDGAIDIAWIDPQHLLLFDISGFRWASILDYGGRLVQQNDYSPLITYFRQFDFVK